jgi:hypothetical protein
MSEPIRNKVAESSLQTIDLESFFPEEPVTDFDLAPWLVQGILLREKDFRASVSAHDWASYAGQRVAVHCSADAIIPHWAYMLVASKLAPVAHDIFWGSPEHLLNDYYRHRLEAIDPETYRDARIVIKGCGEKPVPTGAYLEVVRKLQPVVKAILYGEPCSTVPVYKKPRSQKAAATQATQPST